MPVSVETHSILSISFSVATMRVSSSFVTRNFLHSSFRVNVRLSGVNKLMSSYSKDTPAAVVYKASWPDQKIIMSTLENIAGEVKNADINKTALVYVGRFLADEFELSKLYDKHFSHEFREAKDARR